MVQQYRSNRLPVACENIATKNLVDIRSLYGFLEGLQRPKSVFRLLAQPYQYSSGALEDLSYLENLSATLLRILHINAN
jgi:hypothetical protein